MKCVCVEDEEIFRDQVRDIIENYQRTSGMEISLVCYDKPELLFYDLSEEVQYDLYLLDIDLRTSINGMELAGEIRKRDEKAYIVFLTSHGEYALQGYKYHPFQYILKEQIRCLEQVIEKIAKNLEAEQNQFLMVENRSQTVKLSYQEILYIYKSGKNCVFICQNGREYSQRISLKDFYAQLEAPQMFMVGKGYIINLSHVKALDGYEILFDQADAEPIRISRQGKELVKKALLEFWKGKLQCH